MSDISTIEDHAIRAASAPTRALMESGLPAPVKAVILSILRHATAPDLLLSVADDLSEVAMQRAIEGIDPTCWLRAASALRDLAATVLI